MTDSTIADTGPVVALLDKTDQFHIWASEQAKQLFPPFLTCEAVITEASYLLRGVPSGQKQLLAFIEEGFLDVDFSLSVEIAEIKELMQKYADQPMDLADACIVRMSELRAASVFTIDRKDFTIYRKNGNEQIPLIIPPK